MIGQLQVNNKRLIPIALLIIVIILALLRWVQQYTQTQEAKQQTRQLIERGNQTAVAYVETEQVLYQQLCDGIPMAEAATYQITPGMHEIVAYQELDPLLLKVVEDEEEGLTRLIPNRSRYDVPFQVKPKNLQDIELVVCIEESTREFTSKYGILSVGPSTGTCTTVKHYVQVTLRKAKTAEVVYQGLFAGEGGCSQTEKFAQGQTSKAVSSSKVDPDLVWKTIEPWVNGIVLPTSTPAPTPTLSHEEMCNDRNSHASYDGRFVISPDGKLLASGSKDNTIKLWSIPDGALLRTLKGHTEHIESLVFSPDGTLLVSGSLDKTIILWSLPDGAHMRTLEGHTDWVTNLVISPDGKLLASGSSDKTIKLWSLPDGALMSTLEGHADRVQKLVFSSDGKLLVSGSFDNTIKLWSLPDGAILRTLEGHTFWVTDLAISPDDKLLASSGSNETIKLWSLTDGTLIRTLDGDNAATWPLVISPDGRLLATGSSTDRTIILWSLPDGTILRALEGHTDQISDLVISPDGRLLASGSWDRTIKLWSLPDGTLLRTIEGHQENVTGLALSPDGKLLVSGAMDMTINLWTLPQGEYYDCLIDLDVIK